MVKRIGSYLENATQVIEKKWITKRVNSKNGKMMEGASSLRCYLSPYLVWVSRNGGIAILE